MIPTTDKAEATRRMLAEIDVETRAAERDYRGLVLLGDAHMHQAYPPENLEQFPTHLDSWAAERDKQSAALEHHGVREIPPDPYADPEAPGQE